MEFTIKLDRMPAYVLIETRGQPSEHDFDTLLSTLVEAPDWIPGAHQIVDHRDLRVGELTLNLIERIYQVVLHYRDKLGDGKVAIVVQNSCGFGLSRMYDLIGGEHIHRDIDVFYSLDEAARWLEQ